MVMICVSGRGRGLKVDVHSAERCMSKSTVKSAFR